MKFTLADARTFLAPYVDAGTNDTDLIDLRINEATQHLITAADWKLLVKRARFWIPNGVNHITLPQSIEKIIEVNPDRIPANVFSQYYEFLPGGPGRIDNFADTCSKDLADLGSGHVTYSDPPLTDVDGNEFTSPLKLVAFSTSEDDTNLTIKIRGRGRYNNPIINDAGELGEEIPIIRWIEGVEGEARPQQFADVAMSSNGYKWIDGLIKPKTKGHITIYAYNPNYTDGVDGEPMLHYIGKYNSWETQPSLRRYRLFQQDCCTYIVCLVKLAYVPVELPDDPLIIQSLIALKAMIQGLNFYDDDEDAKGQNKELQALRILDNQLNDSTPDTNEFTLVDDFGLGEVKGLI